MDIQQQPIFDHGRPLLLAVGFIVVGVGVIGALAFHESPLVRTGMIEATEYDVASKIPGRISNVAIREGDEVVAGQELFRLTDREVVSRVGQAQGAVDAAKAQLDMALNGARPEQVAMVERKLEAARSLFNLAEATLNRMRALHADSLIADQELDIAIQKYQAALAGVSAAEAELSMVRTGARSEERRMARGQYDRALQARAEAESYLEETVGLAPATGIVTRVYADVGELVAAGYPVLSILDPSDFWAELNVPETELHLLGVGDTVPGTIRGLDQVVDFQVENLAAMADFANWRAQDDRGTFEVRSFTVTLRPAEPVAGLRPGMTVQFVLPQS